MWRGFLFVVLLCVAQAPWLQFNAQAAHPRSTTQHLDTMHESVTGHGVEDEDYCVDDLTGTIGDSTAVGRVTDALYYSSPKWDLIGSGRLDFWPTAEACGYYGTCTSLITGVEINYCVADWDSFCGDDSSCVIHDGFDGNDFAYSIVRMHVDHMGTFEDEFRRNVNHETGHVVGLCDPENRPWVDCDPEQADTGWAGIFCTTASVMHQYMAYGCSSSLKVLTPQTDDVNNVVAQMNWYHP